MLFFSDFLFTQVRIKEKVVINPQQSLKNNNIIGQDTTSTTQNLDTTGTIVTVRYRRFCFDTPTGGKAFTQSSPCNAYKDSAVINQQGIAQYKFIAYDKNVLTPYRILGYPGCFTYGSDTLIVTDNRGFRRVSVGYWPLIDYQPSEICVVNNPQPQTLDFNNVEVYGNGQLYNGTDISGNICTGIIRLCPTSIPVNEYTLGSTRGSYTTPSFSNPCVLGPSYSNISGCVDEITGKKHLKIEGMKLPLISDICSDPLNRFNDFGDATDEILLQIKIQSCLDFNNVIDALNWWQKGPYSKANGYYPKFPPHNIIFSSLVRAHETKHVTQLYEKLKQSFNAIYKQIDRVVAINQNVNCIQDLINANKTFIDYTIDDAYRRATYIPPPIYDLSIPPLEKPHPDVLELEKEVEKLLWDEYEVIRTRIIGWSKKVHPEWWLLKCVKTN